MKVFIAILLAIIASWITGPTGQIFGITFLQIYDLIGKVFLNALTLVVVPLVASSIITGSARLGSEKSFGKVGSKTCFYFVLTSVLAVCVGIIVVNVIAPGKLQDKTSLLLLSPESPTV